MHVMYATRRAKLIGLTLVCGSGGVASAADETQNNQDRLVEIIVTAQRRAESSQTVPIAVAAFGASDLKAMGATSDEDLPLMVPGMTMQPTGSSRPIFLRGFGTNNNSNVVSAVLVFIHGAYY